MSYDNRVHEIRGFHDDVLDEIVREGEAMLAAQLSVATAADQRAMTLAGFFIAAATAAVGGVVALILSDKVDWNVVLIGTAYAIAMTSAGGSAIWSARPNRFSFPGNEPASWHPEQWRIGSGGPHTKEQARIEQSMTLQSQIKRNTQTLTRNGRWMKGALLVGFLATLGSAAAIGVWGLHQHQRLKAAAAAQVKPAPSCQASPTPKLKPAEEYPRRQLRDNSRRSSRTPHVKSRAENAHAPAGRSCTPSHPVTGGLPPPLGDPDQADGHGPRM